jgi:hypothetical protein
MREVDVRFRPERLRLTFEWLMAASGGDSESMAMISRGDSMLARYLTSISWRERREAIEKGWSTSRVATRLIASVGEGEAD